MSKTYTTQTIAQVLDGDLIGDGHIVIERIAHPSDVRDEHDLALAVDTSLLPLLAQTPARAAIISKEAELEPGVVDACIVVKRPRLAMAKLTNLFAEPIATVQGIHPTAIVEDGAQLGENVSLGAYVYVGAGAAIGANTVLHPHVYVGPEASIGRDALIHSGVRIGTHVQLGDRVIVHFNASIGADGFSFVTPQLGSVEAAKATRSEVVEATNTELVRIASLGTVIVGDDVEIGANTCIDRGTIAATRIGHGTKIDNHVQIGHNVVVGKNCLICGRVGIAGSAIIGDRVVLGGAVGVADHVRVSDDVIAMAMAGIAGNVAPRTIVGGTPAVPRDRYLESFFNINRIKHFIKKLETLTERVNTLEKKGKND
jgi:UDP-3-O-[3-hydroxymyristoyl] glucosamine N-acyltransferase